MSSQGTAIGGSVLAAALFEVLATEKILTKDQCTAVMELARAKLTASGASGEERLGADRVLRSVGELVVSLR
jgi:hypothetical protein